MHFRPWLRAVCIARHKNRLRRRDLDLRESDFPSRLAGADARSCHKNDETAELPTAVPGHLKPRDCERVWACLRFALAWGLVSAKRKQSLLPAEPIETR